MTFATIRISVLCLSLIVSSAIAVSAQTTEFIHRSSLPSSIPPANGSVEMEVRLFATAVGGSQIGQTFSFSKVDVVDRNFAVKLDFGAVAFPGADRFLEFRIRQGASGPFTTVSPRDKVVSVPYAIRALEASSVAGFEPEDFIQNRTSQQPSSNFHISGTGRADTFTATTVTAAGTVRAAQFSLGFDTLLRAPQLNSLTFGRFSGIDLSSSGSNNSFFGAFSGNETTDGSDNTYVGFFSGRSNLTGNNNSAFGQSAGSLATGSGNSFFGAEAGGNTSSRGNNNTFIGTNANFVVTQNAPSGNNTLLGANSKVDQIFNAANIQFATAIGAGAVVTESDTIVLGKPGGTYDGVFRNADKVETVGGFKPTLVTASNTIPVCRTADGFLTNCSSSMRYKNDIRPYLGGLDVVRKLQPISFAWKEGGKQELGFGAEEVFKIEPRFTFRNNRNEIEGVLYAQITTTLVNAVKEQQVQIENLTKQLDELKKLVCTTNKDAADACRK